MNSLQAKSELNVSQKAFHIPSQPLSFQINYAEESIVIFVWIYLLVQTSTDEKSSKKSTREVNQIFWT